MIRAEIRPHLGAPAIFLNGEYREASMLFGRFNPEFQDEAHLAVYRREIARAAKVGIHFHTMFLFMDADLTLPAEQSNEENRRYLREVLSIDPEGYLLPRCLVPYDHRELGMPESENERFTDGNYYEGEDFIRSDFLSPLWREKAILLLTRFIRSIMSDPVLNQRVIGYHFSGGETGEWFQRRYWSGVLNVSEANTRQFRRWLAKKYGTDAALSEAWGTEAALDTAAVPADLPGVSHGFASVGLLEGTENRRFVDYLDYFSDEVVDLIQEAAASVKRETGGNSLFVSFYGYHFEIPGAYSGHNSLARLLRCPDVDILTSPVSYIDRNERGMGAFMSEAASVLAAGKLWLDESDYRMPVVRIPHADGTPGIGDMAAAHEVILREYGKLALVGAGTWWMDLFVMGWFDDDRLWQYISEGRDFYTRMRERSTPAVAEVCYLVDEKAMSLVGDTWQFALDLLGNTRREAYFSGLSFDLRLLEDFLDGKLDGAKLYVFVNPFRLEMRGMETIAQKLRETRASALWLFGFPMSADKSALMAMTGFDFAITPESAEQYTVQGKTLPRVPVSPLTVPTSGEVLGVYPDGRAAFAHTDAAGYPSFFCSGSCAPAEVVRLAAEQAGARLYLPQGDCFNRIGRLAMLHTASAGEKVICFGAPAQELRSGVTYPEGRCILQADAGQTFLFLVEG